MRDTLEADKVKGSKGQDILPSHQQLASPRVSAFPDTHSRDIPQSTSQTVAQVGTQGMYVVQGMLGRWPSLSGEGMMGVGVGEGWKSLWRICFVCEASFCPLS